MIENPLFHEKYRLATKPIEELVNVISAWMTLQIPGGTITGVTRVGKSHAMEYIQLHFSDLFGIDVPVVLISWGGNSGTGSRIMYEKLLTTLKHKMPTANSIALLEDRLTKHLLFLINEHAGPRFVVLIVDEAQQLTNKDYNTLMTIHNHIELNNARLFTLLVGMPELREKRSTFESLSDYQILGRFFSVEHTFRGLKSLDDFLDALESCDDEIRPELGSETTLTQFYLEHPYAEGFRIKDAWGTSLWEGFERTLEKHGFPSSLDFPMQAFRQVVEYLYLVHQNKSTLSELSSQDASDAIEALALRQLDDYAKAHRAYMNIERSTFA